MNVNSKVGFRVPQGSSLGPLMFLIYVNDFPDIIVTESMVYMYADDIVLLSSNPSPIVSEEMLSRDMNRAHEWCNNNCLTINSHEV